MHGLGACQQMVILQIHHVIQRSENTGSDTKALDCLGSKACQLIVVLDSKPANRTILKLNCILAGSFTVSPQT
jgi:hypothetical protein